MTPQQAEGLSPRIRGIRGHGGRAFSRHGSIPAHTGDPLGHNNLKYMDFTIQRAKIHPPYRHHAQRLLERDHCKAEEFRRPISRKTKHL